MRRLRRLLRLSALVAPPLLAGFVALHADPRGDGRLVRAAAPLVAPLFVVMLAALIVRVVEAAGARRRMLDALDVLTPQGRALSWTAGLAVLGAVSLGWASLAVVGVLGTVVVQLLVTWTALAAAGDEPWRAIAATRRHVPAAPVEGDALVEETTLTGARVPPGFRLLVRGGLGAVETRYVVGSEGAGAEIALSAALGPAPRGEHAVAPLALTLQDLFGVCRTRVVEVAPAKLVVLPRAARVDRSPALVARTRGRDDDARPATRLPTEGCFRLREYAAGDDARRIHWPRSLKAQQLIVRQPDEIPPEQPAVRLILDTHLLGVDALATPAPQQLLDAMVRVWLGVARTLAQSGARVTLVAPIGDGERLKIVERPLAVDARAALQLGARVRWQGALPLPSLLDVNNVNIIVSPRPRALDAEATWIIVPEPVWTEPESTAPPPPPALLEFPAGAPENRLAHRRAAQRRAQRLRRDGALFDQLLQWSDWGALRGSMVARPRGERVTLEVL